MAILVDTNIIIDIISDNTEWFDWSLTTLDHNDSYGLCINSVIYAELSFGFSSYQEVDRMIREFGFMTRDVSRYKSYFPSVKLICP